MALNSHAAARISAGLLGQAVHRHAALSRAGVGERAFTRAFRNLVYPQIWEDPLIDLEALEINADCRVVAIASAGCNVLSYLIADPAHITAVDLNAAHVALGRLKISAAQHLPDHGQFFRLFGNADDRANIAHYDALRPRLDYLTRAYWDGRDRLGRRRIEMLSRGFFRYGLLGRFIAAAHLGARLLGTDPRVMLSARTIEEQAEIYRRTLAPLFKKRVVRRLLKSPMSLFGLGIPPAQYRALAADHPDGIVGAIEARLARLACTFGLRENYFAWQAFARRYASPAPGAVPPYLEARHFSTIKARAGRIDVRLVGLTEHLERQVAGTIDRYVLLDAQDWMSDADLARLWHAITRTARPGARVIFRTAATPTPLPGRVPDTLLGCWRYAAERSADLNARDRSAIYGGFHLYVLREHPA